MSRPTILLRLLYRGSRQIQNVRRISQTPFLKATIPRQPLEPGNPPRDDETKLDNEADASRMIDSKTPDQSPIAGTSANFINILKQPVPTSSPSAPSTPQSRLNSLTELGTLFKNQKITQLPDTAYETMLRPKNHHIHVWSSRHNCHLTLADQEHQTIVSTSCGMLGFKHSKRGSFDAAYQLGINLMTQMKKRLLFTKIDGLEVHFRGFGQGREAFQKLILGQEGVLLRDKIVRVSDMTKIKYGGQRSKKPRRL